MILFVYDSPLNEKDCPIYLPFEETGPFLQPYLLNVLVCAFFPQPCKSFGIFWFISSRCQHSLRVSEFTKYAVITDTSLSLTQTFHFYRKTKSNWTYIIVVLLFIYKILLLWSQFEKRELRLWIYSVQQCRIRTFMFSFIQIPIFIPNFPTLANCQPANHAQLCHRIYKPFYTKKEKCIVCILNPIW